MRIHHLTRFVASYLVGAIPANLYWFGLHHSQWNQRGTVIFPLIDWLVLYLANPVLLVFFLFLWYSGSRRFESVSFDAPAMMFDVHISFLLFSVTGLAFFIYRSRRAPQ